MVLRRIETRIPTIEELNLPPIIKTLAMTKRGIIIFVGATGTGKSTSLAAMLGYRNQNSTGHIITIEDPIEYVHHHKKCIVHQREINADTTTFATALKYVLRQDPDVILIGEMRDLETMSAALTIAETGHLVLATLHTNSAYESINRIVDAFPTGQQQQVLSQLAFVLEGVVTQQLIPKAKGPGRVMVAEVLICTPAVRAVIRERKTHQIYSLMQAGTKHGMQTMNQALFQAYIGKLISLDEALGRSSDVKELEQMLEKVGVHVAA
jgi:twitching motility protein PilT